MIRKKKLKKSFQFYFIALSLKMKKILALIFFSLFAASSAESSLKCFYEDVYDMWYLVDYYCVLNIDNEGGKFNLKTLKKFKT